MRDILILCVAFLSIEFEVLAQRLTHPLEQDVTQWVTQPSEVTCAFHVVDISSGVPKIIASQSIEQGNIRIISTVRHSALLDDVIVMYSKDNDVFMTTLKSNGTIDQPSRVPLLADVQSVLLYRYGDYYLCFLKGEQLLFNLLDSQFNIRSEFSLMNDILYGEITSVIEDRKGTLTAYCNGEHINKSGDLSPLQNWMSYKGGVIYSMYSVDGGSSWSGPNIAFKQNLLQLHNALVVTIPDASGEQSLAIMNEKASSRVMYSVSDGDNMWSYPRFLTDNFEGEVLALYVTGSRINVVYHYLSSIYQWKGTLESLERGGIYNSAKLIRRYSPYNEHIISVVPVGKNLLYIFTICSE